MRIAGLTAVALCATAYAYGYWHAATHATFDVSLAYRTGPGVSDSLRNGQIEFLDDGGAVLARASIDTRQGVVWLAHPDRGQCGPDLAQDSYHACFRAQAAWIPQWAEAVRFANVALAQCNLARRDVRVNARRDSLLLWWVPLPHVGGLPYTRYSAKLLLDSRTCR